MKNQIQATYTSYLKLRTVSNLNLDILAGRGAQVEQILWVVGHVGRRAAVGDPTLDFRTETTTLATYQ